MNYDYLQTQAEITYQLVGTGGWAFKKVGISDSADINGEPENTLFDSHRTEMEISGWALISMEAIPDTFKQTSKSEFEPSQTSQYHLFWKRIKVPQPIWEASRCAIS